MASNLAENLLTQSPPSVYKKRVTFEEYLAMHDDNTISEWIDGEVIVMSAVATRHQEIMSFLDRTAGLFIETHDLGKLILAPFAIKLDIVNRGREPDLLFVSKKRLYLIKKTYLDGAADLVVEIVLPESIGRDRGEKFVEYEAAGIKEYWLIDPERESAEFYQLGKNKRYRLINVEYEGVYHSKVLRGFFIRVEWLWKTPLPTIEALQELKVF